MRRRHRTLAGRTAGVLCTLAVGIVLFAAAQVPVVAPAHAQARDVCRNPFERPEITVNLKARPERTSSKLNSAELYKVAGLLPSGYLHLGYTDMQRQFRVQAKVRDGTDPYGTYCYSPSEISVTVTVSPTIYIGTEYRGGTCPHDIIRLHEYRHLDIHERALRDLLADIERRLKYERQFFETRKARDRKQAQARVEAAAMEVVRAAAKDVDRAYRAQHLAMDTEASYRANLGICGAEAWGDLVEKLQRR